MKKQLPLFILPTFLFLFISGCSTVEKFENPFSGSFSGTAKTYNWSAGETNNNKVSYYWLTSTNTAPQTAADYIQQDNGAWYKTNYQWKNIVLNELVREGVEEQEDGSLAPFEVHIRYSDDGEPIYQRYKLDGQVLPLNQWNLNYYTQEASRIEDVVNAFKKDNLSLIQGIWNNREFVSCEGVEYSGFKYNSNNISEQTIAKFEQNQYVSFIAKTTSSQSITSVDHILSYAASSQSCVPRPVL